METQGFPDVERAVREMLRQLVPAAAQALEAEAEAILDQSRMLVPVQTGLLLSTGLVEPTYMTTTGVAVTISYGGHGLAPYAARIEFDTHLNHPNGGQAHFLQEPFFAATDGMLERLGTDLRRGLAR